MRSFTRGLIYTTAVFLATQAFGDSHQRVWPGTTVSYGKPSTLTLHEPTVDYAEATMTFVNEPVHNGQEIFSLRFKDLEVEVRVRFNVDGSPNEVIVVYPPDGYIALPPELSLPEYRSGEIHIVKYLGG